MSSKATKVETKPAEPIKPGLDVWIEGIDDLREFVGLIEKMSVLAIGENDVIVLKARANFSMMQAEEMRELVRGIFGEDRRVLILDKHVDIAIVSDEEFISRIDADGGAK